MYCDETPNKFGNYVTEKTVTETHSNFGNYVTETTVTQSKYSRKRSFIWELRILLPSGGGSSSNRHPTIDSSICLLRAENQME